jgi:non-ribosomal peptide synthetase component F
MRHHFDVVSRPRTLVELFGRATQHFADRPGIADQSRSLTYGEWHAHSSLLADRIKARGVGTEDCVGIVMDRSVDVLVSVIGVIKAGAAYVAVDTRYPDARRDLMLRDSGASLYSRPSTGSPTFRT